MGTPVSGWDQMVRVRDFETKLDIINIRSSLVCDFNVRPLTPVFSFSASLYHIASHFNMFQTLEQRIWEGAQKGPLLYDMHIHKEIGDCGAIDILTKQEWHSKQLLVGARIHLYAHLLPKTRDIGRKPQPKHPRGPPRVERDCVNELSPRDARYPESITYNRSESTVSGKKSSANEDFNKDDAEHEDVLPYVSMYYLLTDRQKLLLTSEVRSK